MRRWKWIVLVPALFALLGSSSLWIIGQYRSLQIGCGLGFWSDVGCVQVSPLSGNEPRFRVWPPDVTQPLWKDEFPSLAWSGGDFPGLRIPFWLVAGTSIAAILLVEAVAKWRWRKRASRQRGFAVQT